MDHTELGRAGELALDLYAMVSSDGELQLFSPVAHDDHVDATAGRRGGVPAIAIQVKTVRELDRGGLRRLTIRLDRFANTPPFFMQYCSCRRSRFNASG